MAGAKDEVLRLLDELAKLTELDEGSPNAFRVRAYQNAKRAVEQLAQDPAAMSGAELAKVKGLGKSTAAKIREFVDTGSVAKLEQLRKKHPAGKLELMRIPGLGAKTVQLLEQELSITDMDGLAAALEDGRVAQLPGLGEKTVENIRKAIAKLGLTSKDQRVPVSAALEVAERIVANLRELDEVVDVAYAGSVRRLREDIGDVDVLVATDTPTPVHEAFLASSDVEQTTGSGPTKTSVLTRDGIQVDLRVVPPESFGAAMIYFTGSKAHNIRLRQLALERGWTLNEYALAEKPEDDEAEGSAVERSAEGAEAEASTGRIIAQRTEEDVYEALGLPFIYAQMREDNGEFEAAAAGQLPNLPTVQDLRGDLHDHTDLSGDGRDSLTDMVAAAVDRGLEYLAITDHAENLRINGVSREAMEQQRAQIRQLEQERGDVHLLHGSELNIGADGSLDYDQSFLETFDWLVASVHSHFGRSVEEQTARVVAAIRNPAVTAIGHLTGRRIGRRPGIDLDIDAVLEAARDTGTAIEINASPSRLDAPAEILAEGARRGVRFVISTDAHATGELDRARFGVAHARRGWVDVSQIANTWEFDRFRAWIDDVHSA